MSVYDGKRLPISAFKLDVERMRQGWYSDKYFINIVRLLTDLRRRAIASADVTPDLPDLDVDLAQRRHRRHRGRDAVVHRGASRSRVVVGVDKALAMLQTCTGYFDDAGTWS